MEKISQSRVKRIVTWIATVSLVILTGWLLYSLTSLYGWIGALSGMVFIYALGGFTDWLWAEERTQKALAIENNSQGVKVSKSSGGIIGPGNATTDRGTDLHPSDSAYPNDGTRYLRDRVSKLEADKADKAVIKSEMRRVYDKINNALEDVDDIKAQVMTERPHTCLHDGELGEMKKAIEANKDIATNALSTASLASDRGFRILMGAVAGLVTFGVAFVVWAVKVSYTADEASMKATQAIEAKADSQDVAPPQIIIASPDYIRDRLQQKKSVQTSPGQAVDIEDLLERAFSRALDNQKDVDDILPVDL